MLKIILYMLNNLLKILTWYGKIEDEVKGKENEKNFDISS